MKIKPLFGLQYMLCCLILRLDYVPVSDNQFSYNTGSWQYRQSCFPLDIQVSKQNNLDSCQKSREVF